MSAPAADPRAETLEATVKLALRRMQTDGLAHQLEMHRTSSQFVARRLTEVLKEFIEVGREKEIQRLLHEIDTAVFERDKTETKLQKARTDLEAASRNLKLENHQLTQARDILAGKLAEIKQKQSQTASDFESTIIARERQIRASHVVLAKTKALLSALAADLSEIRADTSVNLAAGLRLVKSSFRKSKDDAAKQIKTRRAASQKHAAQEVRAKTKQLDDLRAKTATLQTSVTNLKTFLHGLSPSAPPSDSIQATLSGIVAAKEAEAVEQHLAESSALPGLARTPAEFARAAKQLVEDQMKAKLAELESIIAQARKRRLKLQAELDTALEQIRSLQGSRIYDDSDFASNMSPQFDFEGTTRQLDATLSQLGKELGKRR